MTDSSHYAIRGGREGRERLRVLARVMHAGTASFFERLDVRDGMVCLDVGCGGGDASLELARRVAPRGSVVGVDIDDTKLQIDDLLRELYDFAADPETIAGLPRVFQVSGARRRSGLTA